MTKRAAEKTADRNENSKTAGQSFKKSVIIEGFADRSEDGKKTKARLVKGQLELIAGSLKIYSR